MAFDTYKAVKALEEVGFDENAAFALVSMVNSAFTENAATKSDIADMATKADIADMATKGDIAELRTEIRESESRLTARFVWFALSIVIVTTSMTSGIVALLNQLQG